MAPTRPTVASGCGRSWVSSAFISTDAACASARTCCTCSAAPSGSRSRRLCAVAAATLMLNNCCLMVSCRSRAKRLRSSCAAVSRSCSFSLACCACSCSARRCVFFVSGFSASASTAAPPTRAMMPSPHAVALEIWMSSCHRRAASGVRTANTKLCALTIPNTPVTLAKTPRPIRLTAQAKPSARAAKRPKLAISNQSSWLFCIVDDRMTAVHPPCEGW